MFSLPYTYQAEVIKNKKKKTEILNKSENFYFQIQSVKHLPLLGAINVSNYFRTIPLYCGPSSPVMPADFLLELFSDYSVSRLLKEMKDDNFISFPKLFENFVIKKDDDFDNVKEIVNDNKLFVENKMKKIVENIIYIDDKLYLPCPDLYLTLHKERMAGSKQILKKTLDFEYNVKGIYEEYFVGKLSVKKGNIHIPVGQIPNFNFRTLDGIENFDISDFSLFKKSKNEDILPLVDFFKKIPDVLNLSLLTKDFAEILIEYYELENVLERDFIENCFLYNNVLKKMNEKFNKTSDIFHIIDCIIESLDIIIANSIS